MTLTVTREHVQLLRHEKIEAFNAMAAKETPDLRNADLRGVDLRRADLRRADLRGAYLRMADLRGCDLSDAKLDSASIHRARISGVLFPRDIRVQEIRLSLEYGTRMRADL